MRVKIVIAIKSNHLLEEIEFRDLWLTYRFANKSVVGQLHPLCPLAISPISRSKHFQKPIINESINPVIPAGLAD